MSRQRIVGYSLGWKPGSNRAVASIELEDGRTMSVPVETAAELAALAAVLRQSSVFLHDSGLIGTADQATA